MSMTMEYLPQTARQQFTLGQVGGVFEWMVTIGFLLVFSGMFFGPLVESGISASDTSLAKFLYYPIYVLVIVMVFRRPLITASSFMRSFLLLLPVFLAIASTFWSIDTGYTFRRSIALMMTTAFAIYLASKYDWGGLIEVLAATYGLLALFSLLFVLLVPEKGIMQTTHVGAWSGLWWEKNDLGMNMAKAVHLCLCAWIFRPQRKWIWGALLFLSVALVLLSTSKTSLIAMVLAIGGVGALYIFRRSPFIGIPMVYFGVIFGVGLVIGIEFAPKFMFGLIGKDPTLTGRTDIWVALFAQIKDHPWFGHGYAVFWLDETGPAFWVRQRTEWLVPTAHNGWLETWLSIGLVGVILFAVTYISTIIAALRGVLRDKTAYWALISTLVFFLFSMSESNILQQNNLGWIVFAATAAKLFGAGPKKSIQSAEAP